MHLNLDDSEHPPNEGGALSKRLPVGDNLGCKENNSFYSGSTMVVAKSQRYNVEEKPTVILYTHINRHMHVHQNKGKQLQIGKERHKA